MSEFSPYQYYRESCTATSAARRLSELRLSHGIVRLFHFAVYIALSGVEMSINFFFNLEILKICYEFWIRKFGVKILWEFNVV